MNPLDADLLKASPQLGKQILEIDWDTGEVTDLEPYIRRLLQRLDAAEKIAGSYSKADPSFSYQNPFVKSST